MQNNLVVVFSENNARIMHNPPDDLLHDLEKQYQVVVNPDLMHVKSTDTPPHFWKYENGQVLPMNAEERHARLKSIEEKGVINPDRNKIYKQYKPLRRSKSGFIKEHTLIIAISVALSVFILGGVYYFAR